VHAQIHDNACFSLFLSVLLIQFFSLANNVPDSYMNVYGVHYVYLVCYMHAFCLELQGMEP
jgi:hypothetical protein